MTSMSGNSQKKQKRPLFSTLPAIRNRWAFTVVNVIRGKNECVKARDFRNTAAEDYPRGPRTPPKGSAAAGLFVHCFSASK